MVVDEGLAKFFHIDSLARIRIQKTQVPLAATYDGTPLIEA